MPPRPHVAPRKKALILLQENSGRLPLPPNVPANLRSAIFAFVDGLAETFENIKTQLQAAGRYDFVELLTDAACTRQRFLDSLVHHSMQPRVIDVVVLGHGSSESLALHGSAQLTGGATGNIRSLLTDAQALGCPAFKLRMIYMCNCYGSTLNDDWLAIGAKASIGSKQNDYMPEPMTTFFLLNWLAGKKASTSAREAYQATIPFYQVFYPPTIKIKMKTIEVPYPCPTWNNPTKMCKRRVEIPDGVEMVQNTNITETELIVGGDGNVRF